MRPRHMFLFLLCAASVALSPAARAADVSPDQELALQAAHGNYGEIKAGNLAKTSASDAGVREFAGLMVTDHTMSGIELSNAANGAGLTYSEETDAKHQAMLDKLATLKGPEICSTGSPRARPANTSRIGPPAPCRRFRAT